MLQSDEGTRTGTADSRYDLIEPPLSSPQNGGIVGSPHSHRPFGLELPAHDPAICIAGNQATVVAHNANGVDLGGVAPKDVTGLGRRQGGHGVEGE